MFRSVVAFARSGNPNNDQVPEWPASKPGTESVLMLDEATRVRTNPDHALMKASEPLAEEMVRKTFERKMDIQH